MGSKDDETRIEEIVNGLDEQTYDNLDHLPEDSSDEQFEEAGRPSDLADIIIGRESDLVDIKGK